MTNERDPLELLRDAWKAQQAAPPEALAELDPETRATVGYLRDAFAAQSSEPPQALLAQLERREARRARPSRLRLMRGGLALAAAASVLVALRLVWTSPNAPDFEQEPPSGNPLLVASAESTPERVRHIARADYTPRPDGVELRSGSVRLILLTSQTTLEPIREDD